jgi:PAS domain S-box-containing protein
MTSPLPTPPPIPPHEAARLAALHSYRILDTPPEAAFDRITQLAARLFNIPIALVTLVDESRAWFKSRHGIDWQEVTREVTFCNFSLLNDDMLMVPDAQKDDRFACNPLVQGEPGIRFYAGAPLMTQEGFNLGSLCIIDRQPRDPLNAEQQATLTDLAAMVIDELELKLLAQKTAKSEAKYRSLFESIDEGFCICELLFDADGKPDDHRYLEYNSAFERLTGLEQAAGKTARELVPDIESHWSEMYGKVVQTGEPVRYESHSIAMNRWFNVSAFCVGEPQSHQFAVMFTNVTDRKRTEAALQHSEEQSRQILESIHDGFFALDENWQFTYVNQAAEILTGRASSTLLGKIFWEEFPGIVGSEFEQMHYQAMNDRVAGAMTAFYPDHNCWYEVSSFPATHGITVYFRNVTTQVQTEAALRQSEEKSRNILESIGDGFIALDETWKLTYVNHDAERLLHRTATELVGKDFWQEFPGLAGSDLEQLHRRVMNDRVADSITAFYPDHDRWYEVRTYPAVQGITIYFKDVNELMRLEQERDQLLQQEKTARETAEAANRIKDEFLAVLSHELRSPLNPILGWTHLLQNGKLDAARQAGALKTIERNAKLQAQLIEDLLDISRIMQGKLSFTSAPVSLSFVISAAIETVQLAAEAKNIGITVDLASESALVSGDAGRLQQVVWNLLSNAVKFTPKGGKVTVQLREVDQLAQIRVIDTGKGINPQFLPYVFEYFRQEDGSITRTFGGLGLGLAIVRQIVESHGGTVQADSLGDGQGAIFTVKLPLLEIAGEQATLESLNDRFSIDSPLSGRRVLIVDDEPDMRELIAVLLQQTGAEVRTMATAEEVLVALSQFQPDVLLSDIGMPDLDGYELLRQIRALPFEQGGQTPAIALTAYAGDFDQQQALQAGFQQHLAKPVEPDRLIEAVISLLKHQSP